MTIHKQYSLSTCAQADVGRVRSEQQDSLGYLNLPPDQKTAELARSKGHLYIIADGVGGSEAGGLASSLAVQFMIDRYYKQSSTDIETSLLNAINQANKNILKESEKRDILSMYTTIVCAVICGDQLYVAHLGDSRAYLMRSGELKRLTKDHSRVQALIDEGKLSEEEVKTYPARNLITRSLGDELNIKPDISHHDIHANDLLLLCSDGLHGELSDEEIADIMQGNSDLQTTCKALIEQANSSGGKDNISLILTRVTRVGAIKEIENQPKPKASAPKLSQIRQFSHMMLAQSLSDSAPKPFFKKNCTQQQKGFLAFFIIAIYFGLTVGMMLWLQTINSQLQADLDRSQQSLLESKASLNSLLCNYQQGKYGDADEKLEQRLEHINQQLHEGSGSVAQTRTNCTPTRSTFRPE